MIIAMAGLNIKLNNRYPLLEQICADYRIVGERFDFEVTASEADIEAEIELSPFTYLDRGAYESTSLYRKICHQAIAYDAYFIHAAVVAVDDRAYAFLARSGTGKSTHVNLWVEYFHARGKSAVIVNGDKPLLRFMGGELMACGHPWCGKENWNSNVMVPLSALCFLEQGQTNEIRRLDEGQTIDRLFHQLLLPGDGQGMDGLLGLVDRTLAKIPAYELKCTISPEAVATAYHGMDEGDRN